MDLACTGLYTDVASKTLAPGVRAFKPAIELWSDGADKRRWIYLPPGTTIDTEEPDAWRFPVGTKLFKEFRSSGKRVETRMFWKADESRWLKAAYHWSDDETSATRFIGGDVRVGAETYYIPEAKECDRCHKGRPDRALGFEAVSLGLPGATGLTLATLVSEGLLSTDPGATTLSVGDDGTGQAAQVLPWLHINCGVSCHSREPGADSYKSDLYMRLSMSEVRGGATAGVDARTTAIGQQATTSRWSGRTRIVAGQPNRSLLFELANRRDAADPDEQMPPIATRKLDAPGLAALQRWIEAL